MLNNSTVTLSKNKPYNTDKNTHKIKKIIINANAPNYCEMKYKKCM